MILMSTALFLIESDVGATTPVRVCLELEGVHDGLLRNVSFNFSIVGLSLACKSYISIVHLHKNTMQRLTCFGHVFLIHTR